VPIYHDDGGGNVSSSGGTPKASPNGGGGKKKKKTPTLYYYRGVGYGTREARDRARQAWEQSRRNRAGVDQRRRLAAQARRKRALAVIAARRRRAFQELAERNRAALGLIAGRGPRRTQASVRQAADRRLLEQKAAARRAGIYDTRQTRDSRVLKMGETATEGDVRRARILGDLQRKRNYADILKAIRQKQLETGGRFLDRKLYDLVTNEFVVYQEQVKKRVADAQDRLEDLVEKSGFKRNARGAWQVSEGFDADKLAEALQFMRSREYRALLAEFTTVFGDGRRPGLGQSVSALAMEISRANDEYYQRSIFGIEDAGTAAEVAAARRRMSKEMRVGRVVTQMDERGDRRGPVVGRMTMRQYLDTLEARERGRLEDARRVFDTRRRMMAQEGYDYDRRSGQFVDADQQRDVLPTLNRALGGDRLRLMETLRSGNQVDRQRAVQEIKRRSMAQRSIELYQLLGLTRPRNRREAQELEQSPKYQSFKRLMSSFENQLSLTLTGSLAPQGIERVLSQGFETPLLGEIMKGFALLGSGITGGIRWLQTGTGTGAQTNVVYDKDGNIVTDNAKGGRVVTPDLSLEQLWANLTSPGGTGKSALSLNPNTTDEELQHELQAKADFAAVIQDPNSDLGKMFEAIINYGTEPFQGNTGNFLAAALLDPTIALNITKFLGAGRLAMARAGGLKGSLLSPVPVLRDWKGLALPKSMGGFGRHAYTTAETLHDLGKLVGRDIRDAAGLSADDVTTALRDLVEHPRTVAEAQNFIEKQFKVTPINAQQILQSVQEYAVKKGDDLGLRVADSRTVERALAQAERHGPVVLSKTERALADVARERGAETASRAVAKVQAARAGVPAAPRPKTKHTRQLLEARRRYAGLLADRKRFATDAQAAAAELRASADPDVRRAAYDRLLTNLNELDRMDAQILVDKNNPKSMQSVLQRAEENYERELRKTGSPTAPTVAGAANIEITRDINSVRMRLNNARKRLAKMPSGSAKSKAIREIRELELAEKTLVEFKQRNQGQGKVAREVVNRGIDQAEEYVRRPKLVAKSATKEGVQEEGARDLYSTLRSAEIKEFDDSGLDFPLAEHAQAQMASVAPTFRPVDDLDQVMHGLDLWEAITVLDSVVSGGNRFLQGALDHLWTQAEKFIPSGMTREQFMEHMYALHYRSAPSIGIKGFESLDAAVVQARKDAGIGTAKGQGRLAGQSKDPVDGPNLGRADYGVLETVAKVKALRGTGVSVWAYDELRPVMRNAMLKINASENLRVRALARSKKTGETFDEAYEALWPARRRAEAKAQLERYAMQPRFEGWLPDEILAVLDEEQMARDLLEFKPTLTRFQADAMKRAIGELTDVRVKAWIDDPNYMGRVLGGQVQPPPGMRLATPEERGAIHPSIPVFIDQGGDKLLAANPNAAAYHQPKWGVVMREGSLDAALHEYSHALSAEFRRTATKVAIQDVDNLVVDIGHAVDLDRFAAANVRDASGRIDTEELAAELYAHWAMGDDLPLEAVSPVSGTVTRLIKWDEIRASLSPMDQLRLDRLAAHFAALPVPTSMQYGVRGFNVPPLHSRQAAYDWLVENGFWAKRTADTVRSGGRVWSIDAEREFFQTRFGFSPPWTDAEVIKASLDDPRAYQDLMEQFGFLDNGFELHASALNLDADGRANAMAFGTHETGGIKRARTRDELRDWFAKRYGELVVDENGNFHSVPWLMDAGGAEYKTWTEKMIREGKIVNPTLIQPHQMDAFVKAYHKAVDRRLARMAADGRAPVGDAWLPQEQMRFAIDVTNELLLTREWRGLFEKAPLGRRVLGFVGQVQRLLVVAQLAFPVMNLIDRFTVKQVLLMVAGNGYRFWQHVDQDALETLSDLRAINIRERGLWDMRTAGGWTRMRDSDLAAKTRAQGLFEGVRDLGYEISSWGEDSLKLNFAQRTYMAIRDDLIKGGVDPDQARVLALSQTRRKVKRFFPSLEDASDLERGLNQLVPFLSYNARNAVLGLSIVAGHPYLWNLQNNIGRLIEDSNRNDWEAKHPGVPLPDKYARRLLIQSGGETYAIDLAGFSDWFRGPERFAAESKDPDTIGEHIRAWFRVPHPVQSAFVAWLTEGETPWGSQATVSSFAPIADLLPGLFGPGESSGLDATQFLLRQLFFQTVAKVTPTEARVGAYFDLLDQGHTGKARDLLRLYPDVELWLQAHVDPSRFKYRATWDPSWFRGRSREQVAAYEAAKAGLDRIRRAFDARLAKFYDRPWSDEWRALKKERRAAILQWTLTHPELIDARAMSMTWDDWLEQEGEWAVDDLVDSFLAEDERRKNELKGLEDLAFLVAKRQYMDWRTAFLGANPSVDQALSQTRTDLEKAWREQNEQWDAIVRNQLDHQIALAELSRQEGGADPDLRSLLYELLERDYASLDAEAFAQLYESYDGGGRLLDSGKALAGAVRGLFVLPGRADMFYDIADEKQKLKIEKDEAYREGVKQVLDDFGKDFYGGLEQRGLLAEYLKRNPEKRAAYDRYVTGRRYFREITALFRNSSPATFYAELAKNPWLRDQYFARHPDKAAKAASGQEYFNAMKRWVRLLDAGAYDAAEQYFNGLPSWIRERYYAKHPDKRAKAQAAGAYAGAMQQWVKLLKAERYDEAEKYFRSLPQEFQERYFRKHPEQRARYGDQAMLKAARAYFVADDATKAQILDRDPAFAKWLRGLGGDEETRRGLIIAAYRTIPKEEAWIRRVFREQYPEIFSQEAAGERRLRSVARDLAANPKLQEGYERWVEAQYRAYSEQFKRSPTPPKPLDVERVKDWRRRTIKRRRRAARFSPVHPPRAHPGPG
jgi:hypothetical protein